MTMTCLSRIERGLLVLALTLSLVLRLAALDVFLTSDEENWFKRSSSFTDALRKHEWQGTYQAGHPGVLTMWLGAAAGKISFLGQPWILDAPAVRQLVQGPVPTPGAGLPPLTVGARRLIAIVTWLGILALFPLLRKLFDAHTALLATILVAWDPFFLAHSRFHHLDAILATFATLSIVSLLVYRFRERRPVYLIASAIAAGLAIANKSPGVILMPCAASILLLPSLFSREPGRRQALLRAAGVTALWGLVCGLTLLAIWPALWVAPIETLQKVFGSAKLYAENPHSNSNFFWFAERPDPGPAFYPVAWAMRTTPWVLLGLLGLVTVRRRQEALAPAALCVLSAALFTGAMAAGDKKFDRYLLPAFPLLDIVASVGWLALLRRWVSNPDSQIKRRASTALAAALFVGQLALVWPTRPYYISYYNPIFGGGKTAPKLLLAGWGEGLDRVAAYLNSKPNAANLQVSCWQQPELGYFLLGHTSKTWEDTPLYKPDYFVFSRSMVQRHLISNITERFIGVVQPEYVVTINGIDYAWVYRNTIYSKAEQEIVAQADPAQDVILIDVDSTFARNYAGNMPLAVIQGQALERDDAILSALQRFTAGRKHIWHMVYPDAPQDKSRLLDDYLRQQATLGTEITVDGVRAIRYDLPAAPRFVPEPSVAVGARFAQMTLLGYDVSEAELSPGKAFQLRLHWQANEPILKSYTVFTHLVGPDGTLYSQLDSLPQGGVRQTDTWQPGERILDDYVIEVSANAPAGEYTVAVGLYDLNTLERVQATDSTGRALANNALLLNGFKVVAEQGKRASSDLWAPVLHQMTFGASR